MLYDVVSKEECQHYTFKYKKESEYEQEIYLE